MLHHGLFLIVIRNPLPSFADTHLACVVAFLPKEDCCALKVVWRNAKPAISWLNPVRAFAFLTVQKHMWKAIFIFGWI